MDKITFIIESHGDPSVGIWGFKAKVSLDDPIGYDDEDIMEMRKMFADHYDVPVTQVYTEKEYNIFMEEMRKLEDEMEKAQMDAYEAEKKLIEHMKNCSGCPECSDELNEMI